MHSTKGARVVEELLEVLTHIEVATHSHNPLARYSSLTIVGVGESFTAISDDIEGVVGDKLESLAKIYISSHIGMESVHLVATIVERILREGISEGQEGTIHRKKPLITIVIAGVTQVVHHHITLAIAEICRIDRGNAIDKRENRTGTRGVAFTTHIVRSRIGITDVGVEVEPIFRSPFGFQASCHTLEVGVFEDTLVVKVAHGEIDVAIVVALCYSEVVFLAQRGMVG